MNAGHSAMRLASGMTARVVGWSSGIVARTKRNWFLSADLVVLAALVFFLYTQVVSFGAFGFEFPTHYMFNANLSLDATINRYFDFSQQWYRPSSFFGIYWFTKQFIPWHDIAAYKVLNIMTVVAVCWCIYALALWLFPHQRTAGILAAIFFASSPTL